MSKIERWRKNLRYATRRHGSKKELCERVDITQNYLSNLLEGRQNCTLPVAIAIAEQLGVGLGDLLLDTQDFRAFFDRRFSLVG